MPTRRGTLVLIASALGTRAAEAASSRQLAHEARAALRRLYAAQPDARGLGERARAILVFPRIVKVGLLLAGGQTGDGVLLAHRKASGFFHLSATSSRPQAGGQAYSCALFFMNERALACLDQREGWAIGSGSSVVVVDESVAPGLSAASATEDVYAFPFSTKGLMAGSGIEGAKISRLTPSA
ncbi:MAG: twin-arginine translocation pathway signal protein [Alphaproteobacteria bacterium]|nr:twin-arginine translocation pathway signal protein [Alphaproteobacteria bacterium]